MKKLFLVLVLIAVSCAAQTGTVPGETAPENPDRPKYQDDFRPLMGVQPYGLGANADRATVVKTTFSVAEQYAFQPDATPTNDMSGSTTNFSSSISVDHGGLVNQLQLSYQGTGIASTTKQKNQSPQAHSLRVSQSGTHGRWRYVLADSFGYQPNTFGGIAPLLYGGSSGQDVGPRGVSGNTLLNGNYSELTNNASGELSYGLSRKSMLSFNGSYFKSHYFGASLYNGDQVTGGGEYDHRYGRNTVALSYSYSKFSFDQSLEGFETHTAQLGWGRKVLGRFSVSLSGGPTFRVESAAKTTREVEPSAQASVRYSGQRTDFGVTYARAYTTGNGTSSGAMTDTFGLSTTRRLGHFVSTTVSAGFAYNAESVYAPYENKTFFVSPGLTYRLGRGATMTVGYSGQKQIGSSSTVTNMTLHSIVMTFNWSPREIRIQ